jgi:hypothetical protein
MDISLRRFLGLYFLVTSLQYIPPALFMLGVINSLGPNWILPAISFTQGVITACAGFILFRSRPEALNVPGTISAPGIPVLLQLVGVYFLVDGVVGAVPPLFRLLFYSEVWAMSVGTELAAAAVEAVAGAVLITRTRPITKFLDSYSAV